MRLEEMLSFGNELNIARMSRKFLITIVLILFLLPFVSWYYLQSGLNWRKQAQDVMNGTDPFPLSKMQLQDGQWIDEDSLMEKVSLVSFVSCTQDPAQQDVLDHLYQQFKDTGKARFVLLDSCAVPSSPADDQLKGVYKLSCSANSDLCVALKAGWPTQKPFALVDRKGIIRSYYGIGSPEEKRILVEHMSLLLPRERQEKVELKRGEKK